MDAWMPGQARHDNSHQISGQLGLTRNPGSHGCRIKSGNDKTFVIAVLVGLAPQFSK
jgi:hypothetical protein